PGQPGQHQLPGQGQQPAYHNMMPQPGYYSPYGFYPGYNQQAYPQQQPNYAALQAQYQPQPYGGYQGYPARGAPGQYAPQPSQHSQPSHSFRQGQPGQAQGQGQPGAQQQAPNPAAQAYAYGGYNPATAYDPRAGGQAQERKDQYSSSKDLDLSLYTPLSFATPCLVEIEIKCLSKVPYSIFNSLSLRAAEDHVPFSRDLRQDNSPSAKMKGRIAPEFHNTSSEKTRVCFQQPKQSSPLTHRMASVAVMPKASTSKIEEGSGGTAKRSSQRPSWSSTESEFDALRASVVGIRQRLFHLESALSSFVPHIGRDGKKMYGYQEASEAGGDRMARDGSSGGGNRSVNESEEPETDQQRLDADMDGDVEAAVTLEFLHLNLHRFSSDEDWEQRRRKNGVDPGSPAGINGLITREIRKRLWAAMMTDDYFGAAYRRPYAINPIHCTTPLPLNVHDEDLAKGILISRPMDEPTVASKTILSLRVASCIRRFYDEISVAGSQKAALCKDVDAEIRNILRTAPSFIQPDANISHLPEFVSWLRSYHLISTDHKLLVIHRNFAGRSLRGVELAYSKAAVSEAARSILSVFLATKPDFQSVWTLPYHAIVATTTILLEMFQQPSGDVSEKRTLVKLAVARLATFNSTIAVRGVQLIETLIAEDLARRMRSGSSKKRSANEANLPDVQTLAKRMSHSATSSPALSSSTTLSPIGSNGTPHSLSHILSPDTNSGVVDPALSTMDEDGERLSTHMQESQDSLDWLLTNPMEAAWQVGGGDGSLFVQDVRVDFWRLLQGYEAPEDVAGGLDSL
ncbi:hypothetical protein P7C70_g5474, partial [Phenoliferia sp. Uapishka_3]